MSTLYRCDGYKECGTKKCSAKSLHKEVIACAGHYCKRLDSITRCNPVTGEPITSLESTLDAAIIEELKRGTHPFADVAKRIRNRLLEIVST